jgi:hypothetical protein
MSFYDDNSPIGFYDDDDIDAAVGSNQLQADDDDAFDALNGDYDDIMDDSEDELDDAMDADEDRYAIADLPEDETLAAQEIVAQCTGALEDGTPKAAIAIALDMVNPVTYQKQSLANQAMYKPVIEFHSRDEFIEVVFTFPTASDTNLRILYNHLEKYGQKLEETELGSQMAPLFACTIVPIASMGSAYMVAFQPKFWALASKEFGGTLNKLKVLFLAKNVNFYMSDETDVTSIFAAIERERQADEEFFAQAAAKDEERRAAQNADFGFDMSMLDNDE